MFREAVEAQFTASKDGAELAVLLAAFPTNALMGRSIVVNHRWQLRRIIEYIHDFLADDVAWSSIQSEMEKT